MGAFYYRVRVYVNLAQTRLFFTLRSGMLCRSGVLLGVLWGLWHAPVVDYLGAAVPHGAYWLPFFLSFVAIVTAMRVLIVWVYSHTGSVFLAWLMHLSMTAALVILGPGRVSPAQETLWDWGYAVVLWIVVVAVALRYGKYLVRQPMAVQETKAISERPAHPKSVRSQGKLSSDWRA